jgi:hypothetical protein
VSATTIRLAARKSYAGPPPHRPPVLRAAGGTLENIEPSLARHCYELLPATRRVLRVRNQIQPGSRRVDVIAVCSVQPSPRRSQPVQVERFRVVAQPFLERIATVFFRPAIEFSHWLLQFRKVLVRLPRQGQGAVPARRLSPRRKHAKRRTPAADCQAAGIRDGFTLASAGSIV